LLYYLSITLTIVSNILYHLFQKSIAPKANPLFSLTVTYFTAALISLILWPFFTNGNNLSTSFRNLNWASFALGIVIIGLELGFLLAYRAGWNITLGSLVSNLTVSLLLIPIGIILFKERLSLTNVVGIALSIIGFICINIK
jgi:drug/metabolite transporter (DMT)-like permease